MPLLQIILNVVAKLIAQPQQAPVGVWQHQSGQQAGRPGRRAPMFLSWLLVATMATSLLAAPPQVNESARDVPVAYDVDVVVVGGSTGAVAAAVAAAEQGAKVFLAAPHPYLGDDMTATLRLWLEKGEEPTSELAKQVFNDSTALEGLRPDPNRIPLSYEADQPSAKSHKDTQPASLLTDGKWSSVSEHSVQYDADVNLTADLKKPQPVKKIRVMYFQRRSSNMAGAGFDVGEVEVLTSDDDQTWKPLTTLSSADAERGPRHANGDSLMLEADVDAQARYVKLTVKKPATAGRILLGEVEIVGAGTKMIAPSARPMPRPMHVKKTLDDALLAAGVEYLYSCYPTDVLRDAQGNLCGIVMANRAGRQAVRAKTIIDATPRAVVARLAGAEFRPFTTGLHTFNFVVIGGEVQQADNLTARTVAPPFEGPFPNRAKTSSGTFEVIEYTLKLPLADDSYASLAAAEQTARSLTYHPEQQFTSDELFEIPPDAMFGSGKSELEPYRPKGVARLLVLGGCADVPRAEAAKLLRPLALMDLGQRLGTAAAAEAKTVPAIDGAKIAGVPTKTPVAKVEIREPLDGVRSAEAKRTVPQDARALPVLGNYDVVVIGGGTGGAPAGISAARYGAKTLVIEYLHGLGGVGTQGAISTYYWGNRVGFTASVPGKANWVIEQRMQWWRRELLVAGGELWFGTLGCGAVVDGNRVVGAVVTTPQGRGVVLAKVVIDATGNSDVAAAAGADCYYTDASEFGMQGTGLPGRRLGETYNNTDFTIVDETDMLDVWRMFVFSKEKYPQAFDHGRLIDTRERRRIVGDFTITMLDEVNGRTYPDSIVAARSNFDTHGFTIDPYLLLEHPGHSGFNAFMPYRAFLPKGFEGILVTGLGVSAHRDAVPLIRMQPDIQNGGYAAGRAAAMAAEAGVPLRKIDMKALQRHLVEMGNLPESVLTDKDSFPLSDAAFDEAVATLGTEGRGAAVLLTDPSRAIPRLRNAYAKATNANARQTYAMALAVLGDPTGVETLIEQVRGVEEWDKGWNYRGMGQFGTALSPLDNLIVALGRTGDARAVPVIVEKLKRLTAEHDFSHHRAVALALELIGELSATEPLAELLQKPGIAGFVCDGIDVAKQQGVPGGTNSEAGRRTSLRELILARALYRCGDSDNLGRKTLEAYTHDLRGHLARHARAVLAEDGKP